jgi:hypothetical protein
MNRGRVGEERGDKETDRCPLTVGGVHKHHTSHPVNTQLKWYSRRWIISNM